MTLSLKTDIKSGKNSVRLCNIFGPPIGKNRLDEAFLGSRSKNIAKSSSYKLMQQTLSDWFQNEKRLLPWRENPTPYAVWISEVMLQQTQVAVVIPYFNRWMQEFPDVHTLAAASIDRVIKLWEGLGYYSRARNLHAGACYIVEKHGGELPQDKESLSKIKGLGPYTVGAIRSFAFHQKSAAVDGNVMRVLSRHFYLSDDISLQKTVKKFWSLAEELLPESAPWIFNEALIELGATVCTKKPSCLKCPVKDTCMAYRHGVAGELPYKSKKIAVEMLFRSAAVILTDRNAVLVKRVQKGSVMSDLYEFPYFETSENESGEKEIVRNIKLRLGLDASIVDRFPMIRHAFTRFNVRLFPTLLNCSMPSEVPDFEWVAVEELQRLPFSSGHKRLLQAFLKRHAAIHASLNCTSS